MNFMLNLHFKAIHATYGFYNILALEKRFLTNNNQI